MFNSLKIPFGAKMLFNVVKLKPNFTLEDAELAMREMCHVVKNTYRDEGGFIAGQVFNFAGFVSEERGSLGSSEVAKHSSLRKFLNEEHLIIVTYWQSFEQHEISHADTLFQTKFSKLLGMCEDTFEIGYEML